MIIHHILSTWPHLIFSRSSQVFDKRYYPVRDNIKVHKAPDHEIIVRSFWTWTRNCFKFYCKKRLSDHYKSTLSVSPFCSNIMLIRWTFMKTYLIALMNRDNPKVIHKNKGKMEKSKNEIFSSSVIMSFIIRFSLIMWISNFVRGRWVTDKICCDFTR